jgi:hypothetical protein
MTPGEVMVRDLAGLEEARAWVAAGQIPHDP